MLTIATNAPHLTNGRIGILRRLSATIVSAGARARVGRICRNSRRECGESEDKKQCCELHGLSSYGLTDVRSARRPETRNALAPGRETSPCKTTPGMGSLI